MANCFPELKFELCFDTYHSIELIKIQVPKNFRIVYVLTGFDPIKRLQFLTFCKIMLNTILPRARSYQKIKCLFC
jgi:hypothetical protein